MTPLVMVHGFMGGSDQWAEQAEALEHDANLICLDLPGFGRNADLPVLDRIGQFADWVIAQLRSQQVETYHLLGHSMGGMVAQEIAFRDAYRVERLVLYATGPVGVLPGRFETIEQSKQRVKQDGPEATARRIAATWFLDRECAPGYEACAAIAALATEASMLAGLDAMQAWSGVNNLNRIEAETLVLWGDRDRTYQWEQIHQLWRGIPQTNLAVVPNCAHAVHAENPGVFNKLLAEFLDGSP